MDNNAIARAANGQQTTWTNIPPAMSGYQTQGASLLPFGNYRMPDGSNQVSFGLPQPMLDAYRSMRYGFGYEQDPSAPQGFMSNNAIAAGANGLAGSAIAGSIPAAASNVILRGASPTSQLNSGFMSGLRNSVSDMARSLTGARERVLQERVDNAIPYRQVSPSSGTNMSRQQWLTSPRRILEDMVEARLSVEEMAQRVGETPEVVAKYIKRLDREGLLGSRRQDPLVSRDNGPKFQEALRQANLIDKTTSKGQRAQEALDRRQGNRYEDPPERLPPPQRQGSKDGGSLEGDNPPFSQKQVEADPVPQLPAPDKPKKASTRLSDEQSGALLDGFENWLTSGKELPGAKSKKSRAEFKQFLSDNGVEVSDSALNNRLRKYRDTGKTGDDLVDWSKTSRKAGTLKAGVAGVPVDPTEPDAGSDFDHVTESGVVKVGDDD